MCSDRQRFFVLYDHTFEPGGGGESLTTLDESVMRPQAYSFALYALEVSLENFSEGEREVSSAPRSASEFRVNRDPEPGEGEWVMVGNKECESFNSCHGNVQNGRCHEFH